MPIWESACCKVATNIKIKNKKLNNVSKWGYSCHKCKKKKTLTKIKECGQWGTFVV
jgi:rRNA maturation endonuclease Nob1